MTPNETAELMTAVSDVIQDHIALALREVMTKLAVAESQIAAFVEREKAWLDVRDRLIAVEIKAASVVPAPPIVDLGPVIERISGLDARLGTLGDVDNRVTSLEVKAARPPVVEPPAPVDLSPVLERMASVEARLSTLGDVRDRVAVVEIKADRPASVPSGVLDRLTELESRLSATELRMEMKAAENAPLVTTLSDLTKDIGAMRERVAVVEVRAQVPGPAGKDGQAGKDGVDGLGFDDLIAVQNDDRSFTVKAQRGDRVKDIGTARFPVQIQRGVYIEGKSYELGDLVTWGGSQWHCDEATSSKPGDGSKGWTLVVKRGRDGKDGKDAVSVPVVSVGRQS